MPRQDLPQRARPSGLPGRHHLPHHPFLILSA